ncbi:MAG: TIGR00266 family protein [Myxococcales bacterium]|nr:TIGR00266 family protein [Myxococcales bacterium]MCA9569781.1 TIGR00266 family protein [Myxococcales bacterium]
MRVEVRHRPAYALAVVHLDDGETVVGEAGALVSRDTNVVMETSAGSQDQGLVAGLFTGLKRMVAGESFFQNRYTAQGGGGEVTLAPALVGDIEVHELSGETIYLQSKAFLCAPPSVTLDTSFGGSSGFFGSGSLFLVAAKGTGPVAFNAFGAVRAIDVDGELVVDTGHVVAFEGTLTFAVARFGGGWMSFLFGGEGLVCRFSGKGRVWIQTRNPVTFGGVLGPLLPKREA